MASPYNTLSYGAGGVSLWFVLGFVVSSLSQAATGDPIKGAESTPASVPVASSNTSSYADMIVLTVDKTVLRADLQTWPEDPQKAQKLQTFRIAIGKADGDKQWEGDNKTPEGIYFALRHIDGKGLPEKYGDMAIPINFPNPMDQVQGKTGHGIWLHGVEYHQRIEEAKVTEGCVAFYNPDISKLSGWLKSHQGVVVIADDTQKVNRMEDLQDVRSRTLSWLAAWQNRKVDDYIGHYSKSFSFSGFDYQGYKNYKNRVFKSYKKMNVNISQLRVISHPKYAIALFNQDFQGDSRYHSIGRKILYWERDGDNGWQIKREVYENRRFERMTFTDSEMLSLSGSGEEAPPNPNL